MGWCRCGCACTFPRKERAAKTEGTTAGRQCQRPSTKQRRLELQFVRAARRAGKERRRQPVGEGQAVHTSTRPQSTQQACQCKKAANARCWECAAAARQVKADLWAGATIDMTNRGSIGASVSSAEGCGRQQASEWTSNAQHGKTNRVPASSATIKHLAALPFCVPIHAPRRAPRMGMLFAAVRVWTRLGWHGSARSERPLV